MVHNYFFRSKWSTRRALLFPITLQLGGTGLFVASAIILTAVGWPHDKVLSMAISGTIGAIIASCYLVHRQDLKLLRSNSWPLDTAEDFYKASVQLLPRVDRIILEQRRGRREIEILLVENHQLQKEANSMLATKRAARLKKLYREGVDLRGRIIKDMNESDILRNDIEHFIQSFESIYSLRIEHREIKVLNQRIANLRSSTSEIQHRSARVHREQQNALRPA